MLCLLDSLIYLLAIMGIIFTTMTFFEMFLQNIALNNTYRIFCKNSGENNKVKVVIKLKNVEQNKENEIVQKIRNDEKVNLKEFANEIIIQKE